MAHVHRIQRASRSAGFTLVETVFSIGILALVIIVSNMAIMSATRLNRTMAMQAIAEDWMRLKAEEVQAIARDSARRGKVAAQAVLFHYGAGGYAALDSSSPSDTLPLGPGGTQIPKAYLDSEGKRLICHFSLPIPGGESGLFAGINAGIAGPMVPDRRAVGRMVFYLDETLVPAGNADGTVWRDRGLGDAVHSAGFDMNRDGALTPRESMPAPADFREPRRFGILQLPVDISVVYFDDDTHKRVLFDRAQRIVITGNNFDKKL